MGARLSPIMAADVPEVARFLTGHLNHRVPAERWTRALSVPWGTAQPNHGFQGTWNQAGGPYTLTLTVSNNAGVTASDAHSFTVYANVSPPC